MFKGHSTQNQYKTQTSVSVPKSNFTIKRNRKMIYMSFYKLFLVIVKQK